MLNRSACVFVIGGMLLLSGCQSLPKSATSLSLPQPQAAAHQFYLTGKIGVRTPQQNGSAFYAWAQEGQRFAIELSGAMGIGQTRIEGIPNHVTLDSSKTGRLEADTPEALLQQATGWQAPISHLPRWIMGLPIAADSPMQRDTRQRLIHVEEQGWVVQLDYRDDHSRPHRLIMTQPLLNGENRVTMTIQTRQETP
ncbi:MAG: lipoprotein insertase outer membrane protein LolB [Pseudomonadota bacterium]|nr:lipoprotein insertase outer membrane protein LolB [Pseudomonadota bacterium]